MLSQFHCYHQVFVNTGATQCFSLPWQHSLTHYFELIKQFSAPNGLCSSITESKHVKAVKKPYRHSSHHQALGQMLVINQRLDKLKAARTMFQLCGMLIPRAGAAIGHMDILQVLGKSVYYLIATQMLAGLSSVHHNDPPAGGRRGDQHQDDEEAPDQDASHQDDLEDSEPVDDCCVDAFVRLAQIRR